MIVSEAGASVYFRKQARRGGISAVRRQPPLRRVSIARRLHGPAGGAGEDRPQVPSAWANRTICHKASWTRA